MHNGGVFMVTKPIDGGEACCANGGTIGFAMSDPEQTDAWHQAGVAHGGTLDRGPARHPRGRLRQALSRLSARSERKQALRRVPVTEGLTGGAAPCIARSTRPIKRPRHAASVATLATLAIASTADRFPVRRIFCVGRSYADHAREMGRTRTGRNPFSSCKPADAVVPGDRCCLSPAAPPTCIMGSSWSWPCPAAASISPSRRRPR